MLYTISPADMKRIEAAAMAERLVSGEALMERAAAHVAAAVARCLSEKPGRVLAVCGPGNNGGDGLAAVRLLFEQGVINRASVLLMEGDLSADNRRELKRLAERHSDISMEQTPEAVSDWGFPPDTACIVDALFGTGLTREIEGETKALCLRMTEAQARGIPVIAVDIPSGLNGETGQVMGAAVRATETVSFHRPKNGLYLGLGPNYTGTVVVGDIGIPAAWDGAKGYSIAEVSDMPRFFPPRLPVTHKGSYGRVLVIAGSLGMAGAAALNATAALRTGAGLVTIACPDRIVDALQQLCPCATCVPLPEDAGEAWAALAPALALADAVSMGCGMGTGGWASALVRQTACWIAKEGKPAVIDADALNILAREETPQAFFTPAQIFTPHPAEAARLLKRSISAIISDVAAAARDLGKRYGASVVLKGAVSLLLSGAQAGLNVIGTPALAKGGSGDALAGVLAALLAGQACGTTTLSSFETLQAGSALHGMAAIRAASEFGERGVMASDVCSYLGRN